MTRTHYRDDTITLYTGDAVETLAQLPDASVDCVVTSPPAWRRGNHGRGTWVGGCPCCAHTAGRAGTPGQTRALNPAVDYPAAAAHRGGTLLACTRCGAERVDGQYGHEPTASGYVETLRTVFGQLWRVLADDGTAWLHLGDAYTSTCTGIHTPPPPRSTPRDRGRPRRQVLPAGNLMGLPWRVAFALQADGWILRNAIVWHQPNAMPESVTDRYSTKHELLFLLVKYRRYHFDLDAIREPVTGIDGIGAAATTAVGRTDSRARHRRHTRHRARKPATTTFDRGRGRRPQPGRHGTARVRPTGCRHKLASLRGRTPGDVWSIATRPRAAAHLAAFPLDLPSRCIAAGSRRHGVVLDPFSGAGTTGLAARRLGRNYIGIDLNPSDHDIALFRLGLTSRTDQPSESDEPGDQAA